MRGNELIELFKQGVKRHHLVGDLDNGVVIGLDLEGRLFTIFDGEVVSKVNPEAILNVTTREAYLNPGGDGLWPAPEGTCLGYEYSTNEWRVPPGLTGAKFIVTEESRNHAVVAAEVDLINAAGLGVATIFSRDVSAEIADDGKLVVKVVESIEYIGTKTLSRDECLLVPWSLCQFDCCPGCEVVFPEIDPSEIWDMYEPSDSHRFQKDGLWHVVTDGTLRFQVGMSEVVPWIELRVPEKGIKVTRIASLPDGLSYIDIVDADPSESPSDKGVRYSAYCDTDGFMEIEASGGAPVSMSNGSVMPLEVVTIFEKIK